MADQECINTIRKIIVFFFDSTVKGQNFLKANFPITDSNALLIVKNKNTVLRQLLYCCFTSTLNI